MSAHSEKPEPANGGNGQGNGQGGGAGAPGHTSVVFFIDKEKFTVNAAPVTPRDILTKYAKEDAGQTTLVEVNGANQTKLTALDTPITVKDGTHFTVLHNGPTTVS